MFLRGFAVIILLGTLGGYSVVSLKCYKSSNVNVVDVDLTSDTLPESPSDCGLVDTKLAECYIGIRWYSEPHESVITRGDDDARDYTQFGDRVTYISATFVQSHGWERWVTYYCQTDGCNNQDSLRRVLRALTIIKETLKDGPGTALAISGDLSSNNCEHISNATKCTNLDGSDAVTGCEFCHIDYRQDAPGTSQVCARCQSTPLFPLLSLYNFLLQRIRHFTIASRVSYDVIKLQCQFPNCNSIANVDLILHNSQVDFDFSAFPTRSSANCRRPFLVFVILVIILIQGARIQNTC